MYSDVLISRENLLLLFAEEALWIIKRCLVLMPHGTHVIPFIRGIPLIRFQGTGSTPSSIAVTQTHFLVWSYEKSIWTNTINQSFSTRRGHSSTMPSGERCHRWRKTPICMRRLIFTRATAIVFLSCKSYIPYFYSSKLIDSQIQSSWHW